jgi:hypothetical protein
VHHLLVTRHLLVDDHLPISQAGAIVNLKERKGFRISPGSNPTCDLNVPLGAGRKGVFDKRNHKTGMCHWAWFAVKSVRNLRRPVVVEENGCTYWEQPSVELLPYGRSN